MGTRFNGRYSVRSSISHPYILGAVRIFGCPKPFSAGKQRVNRLEMSNRKLSVTELPSIFEGKDRTRNTRYWYTTVTNPDSPRENVEIVDQFRMQNPHLFLTNDEVDANPDILRGRNDWKRRQDFRNGNKFRKDGSVRDSWGDTHDFQGQSYDRFGRPYGSFDDGGSYEYHGYSDSYKPSGFFMTRNQLESNRSRKRKPSRKNDPSEPLSHSKVNGLMYGLKTDYARTRYLQSVRDNPNSHPQTVANLQRFRDLHPNLFMDEGQAYRMAVERKTGNVTKGQGRSYFTAGSQNIDISGYQRDYDKETWDKTWLPKHQFDAMPNRKKSLYSKFVKNRDRNVNSKQALGIVASETARPDDKQYTVEIVREHPAIFFKSKR